MRLTKINSFSQFDKFYQDYKTSTKAATTNTQSSETVKHPILLFVASQEDCSNQSWCTDCRRTKPVLDRILKEFEFNEQLALVQVEVGSRDEWNKPDNPYRTHELQIEKVPTLLSLSDPKTLRLMEDECTVIEKVKHLFSNSI